MRPIIFLALILVLFSCKKNDSNPMVLPKNKLFISSHVSPISDLKIFTQDGVVTDASITSSFIQRHPNYFLSAKLSFVDTLITTEHEVLYNFGRADKKPYSTEFVNGSLYLKSKDTIMEKHSDVVGLISNTIRRSYAMQEDVYINGVFHTKYVPMITSNYFNNEITIPFVTYRAQNTTGTSGLTVSGMVFGEIYGTPLEPFPQLQTGDTFVIQQMKVVYQLR